MEEKYNAGLMSQSFWFIEFKKIVLLYHEGNDYDEIKRQCLEENLFGAINPYRGFRQVCFFRSIICVTRDTTAKTIFKLYMKIFLTIFLTYLSACDIL